MISNLNLSLMFSFVHVFGETSVVVKIFVAKAD